MEVTYDEKTESISLAWSTDLGFGFGPERMRGVCCNIHVHCIAYRIAHRVAY